MTVDRIVCHFSCGAASAVATKLAIAEHGKENLVIYNAFIVEEDSDNRRFLADCEKWFGHPVTVLRDEKYGASAHNVWKQRRYSETAIRVCAFRSTICHQMPAGTMRNFPTVQSSVT